MSSEPDRFVVTIDGPAASGKSTIACLLAARLGAAFLDTGAMYRALTLTAMNNNITLTDSERVMEILNRTCFDFAFDDNTFMVSIDGNDVTERIRDPEVTEQVRYIAAEPLVRTKLVEMQRDFAGRYKRIVTEGRDQGTVVFPNADLKFFLTADELERSRRRQNQLKKTGKIIELSLITEQMKTRDCCDKTRPVGPLTAAPDAITIDTTDCTIDQVVDKLLGYIRIR